MEQLKVNATTQAGCRVVAVAGEVDLATSAQLHDALERNRTRGTLLIADLADVGFCDASGLRALLAANLCGREQGVRLRIVPSRAVRRLTQLAGAVRVLALYSDTRRALHRSPIGCSHTRRAVKRRATCSLARGRARAWHVVM